MRRMEIDGQIPEQLNIADWFLGDRLREGREAQNAGVVLLIADLVKTLNPGNQRMGSFTKWAHDLKNRPEVKIRGCPRRTGSF